MSIPGGTEISVKWMPQNTPTGFEIIGFRRSSDRQMFVLLKVRTMDGVGHEVIFSAKDADNLLRELRKTRRAQGG